MNHILMGTGVGIGFYVLSSMFLPDWFPLQDGIHLINGLAGFIVGASISTYNFISKLHSETEREESAVESIARKTLKVVDSMIQAIGTSSGSMYEDVYKNISQMLNQAETLVENGGAAAFEGQKQAMSVFKVASQNLPDISGHSVLIQDYFRQMRDLEDEYDAAARNYDRFASTHRNFVKSFPFGFLAQLIAKNYCQVFPLAREQTGGQFSALQNQAPTERAKFK